MRENKLPFEVMSIYNNKMLASRAKLALLRVRRVQTVSEQDKRAFSRLAWLLDAAAKGDSAISGSRLSASSEQSLAVLRETLTVLINTFPEAQRFRDKLQELRQGAEALSKGTVPSLKDMNELLEFTHKYGLVQAEMLKERRSTMSTETKVWPVLTSIGYSSISY